MLGAQIALFCTCDTGKLYKHVEGFQLPESGLQSHITQASKVKTHPRPRQKLNPQGPEAGQRAAGRQLPATPEAVRFRLRQGLGRRQQQHEHLPRVSAGLLLRAEGVRH